MSPRILVLLSPFGLAVLIGLAVPNIDEPETPPRGPMENFSLDRYLWHRRPILVFSPSPFEPRYQEAAKILARNAGPLAGREAVVVEVVRQGINRAEGRPIPRVVAEELRGLFGVEPEQFAVILVGMDGTTARRWEILPPLRELYELIDAEALRRPETTQPPGDGPGEGDGPGD
ncbi:DUF4174 domain-containing protein [Tautonia plasticadhaerens]|uniref:DUF4174 domain-containing protein n=1 Tax=Tautonia plasticadhaerens TaxID=2527974 RepID=A0A518HAI2_9BACT|nr:DUF4174 domain-containing protein [Tautonia plasticadhaerens]QDV37860.1 hypothetical protein ElP_58070 [Tautonia plasticadhaerens]